MTLEPSFSLYKHMWRGKYTDGASRMAEMVVAMIHEAVAKR